MTELLSQVHWGETSQGLLRQFDGAATQLPRSLDFGDSYVDVVLDGETVGGVPVITFFQMDHGRIGDTVDGIDERQVPRRLEYLTEAAGLVLEKDANKVAIPFTANVLRPAGEIAPIRLAARPTRGDASVRV
jgi:hypothetical protein